MSGPSVPRQPKCARCRHHGSIVRVKGHGRSCPFLRCLCWKCQLQTQKTRVTALQKNLTRTGDPEPPWARPSCGGGDLTWTWTRRTEPDGGSSLRDSGQVILQFPLWIPDQFCPPADLLLCLPPGPLMSPPVQQGPVVLLPPPENYRPVLFIAPPPPPPPPPQRVSVGAEVRTSSLRRPDPVLQM